MAEKEKLKKVQWALGHVCKRLIAETLELPLQDIIIFARRTLQ